jgi:hypothetical protein
MSAANLVGFFFREIPGLDVNEPVGVVGFLEPITFRPGDTYMEVLYYLFSTCLIEMANLGHRAVGWL